MFNQILTVSRVAISVHRKTFYMYLHNYLQNLYVAEIQFVAGETIECFVATTHGITIEIEIEDKITPQTSVSSPCNM